MKTIREILLEIYVNNVSSGVLQKYLYQTFVEWLGTRDEGDEGDKERDLLIHKFTRMTTKMNYMLATANKDVLFHELYILEMIKVILFQSA